MKKLLSLVFCGLLLFGCSDKYDDSALRNDLNDLENRVTKLEELCTQMNTNISSLQKIVDALQDNLSISKVEQISDGYIIHFSDGSTATIKNGKNSGDAPIIGVKKDTDGIYYWTLNGEWLTDDAGDKIKAEGMDGENGNDGTDGENGQDGITPQLKIENGRWMLSMDNGKTWTDIGQATGADGQDGADGTNGKDGDSFFQSVTEDDNNVYFTLIDGTVITIPKGDNSQFAIAFDTTDIAILNGGESKTISYTITDATENTVVKAIAQDGWKVKVNATSTDKGTITITAPDPIVESEILVFANDGSYRTVMASFYCHEKQVLDINIADNSINVLPAGGTQEIKLTTNLDYTVEIPDNARSWLSLAPETRALREDTIVFEVAANEGIQRHATVTLKGEQDNILQTIIFRQLGTCTEIHVETKGELENVLAGYDYANIESLKITGVLNDVDFLFIYRMMPKLKNLDIAEVNITALPTQAFYKSTNVEHLILPKTLTTIGKEMFYRSKLKSVVIPASVETIEAAAFMGCSSLATVTFEKGSQLKTIGGGYSSYYPNYYGAFADCTALTSIEIPASVETIEATAFKGCSSLATVTFEKGSQLKTIGGGYYYHYYYGVFSDCTALKSIEIPASVETIEAAAFMGCSSLATVTFEKGSQLKTIGGGYSSYYPNYYGAFADCTALTSIEIPASVETIEATAFKGCSSLATVTFEKGSQLKTIGGGYYYHYYYGVFSDCTALKSIEIPASVETIEAAAFMGCSSLATVTFEKGSQLKTIGGGYSSYYPNYYGAFADCTALTSIEIPASVETIEATAFKGCSSLATVTFEKGSQLKTIGGGYYYHYYYGVFSDCTALKSIEIPASVETIEATAFKGCSSLATVTFEKGSQLKTIGGGYYYHYYYGVFSDCTALKSIEIPASVETIEATAFKGCSSLATVTFEKGSQLKTIGGGYYSYSSSYYYGAFCQLKNLMTVDMSACTQIETIGECAFYGDFELRLFKIGTEIPPTCENYAFSGINPYSVLKVPSGCADAYKAATEWKRFASTTGLDE
ncbi:leucine-rich repeat protein [Alistipes putredinis]|uniref:leucine-rich repeat protein n=6 Tax=Bacteroidia TaxID=200643 RepID=UPI0039933DA5